MSLDQSPLSISFLLERVLRLEAYESRIQTLEGQNRQLIETNQKLDEDFKILTIKFDEFYQAQLKTNTHVFQDFEKSMYYRSIRIPDEIEIIDLDPFAEIKPDFKNLNDETIAIQEPSTSKKVQPQNLEKEKSPISYRTRSSTQVQINAKSLPTSNSQRSQKRASNLPIGKNYLNKKIKIEPKERQNYTAIQPGIQPHVCLICKETFPTLAKITNHMKIYHKVDKINEINLKSYKCTICTPNVVFPNSDHLKTHLRNHSVDDLYRCSICPRRFFQVGDLNGHLVKDHNQHLTTKSF